MNEAYKAKYFIRKGILYKSCPSCSKEAGKDIYYECPKGFGYRHNISQSSCSKCRSSKIGPFEGYTTQAETDNIIPEIRCLPMGKSEFPTLDDCIDFLTSEMPERGNTFYYKSHNLKTKNNSLILFQYDGKIIAYGFYESEQTEKMGEYNGFYKFINNSIKIIEKPVSNEIMENTFNTKLGQGTSHISMSHLPLLLEYIMNDSTDLDEYDMLIEEIPEEQNDDLLDNVKRALKNIGKEKLFELSNNIVLEETNLEIVPYKEIDRKLIAEKSQKPNYFNKITKEYIKTKDSQEIENYIFQLECEKVRELITCDQKENLINQMSNFYKNRKDVYGYDILSFEKVNGEIIEKYIDVKSTKKNTKAPIDMSRNEYNFAKEKINQYYIYRVIIIDESNLQICEISGKDLFDNKKYDIQATEYKIYGSS